MTAREFWLIWDKSEGKNIVGWKESALEFAEAYSAAHAKGLGCKRCAFWHEHEHKSLTKGTCSDCGHPVFLGTNVRC